MKNWTIAGALLVVLAGMLWAQNDPFYIVQSRRGLHITAGTAFPSITTTGNPPADGMLHIDLSVGATENPVLWLYSDSAAAWVPVSPIGTAVGSMPSTLVTNAVDVANSVWGGTNQLIFESTTANGFEAIITAADTITADVTITIPIDNAQWDGAGTFVFSDLITNAPEALNAVWMEANTVVFEGTQDAFEHRITPTDVGQDIAWTLPDIGAATGAIMYSTLATNNEDVANSVTMGTNQIRFEGATGGDGFQLLIESDDMGQDLTLTIDDYGVAAASMIPVLAATNVPEAANSVWVDPARGFVYEGAGVDAFEIEITGGDSTVGIDTYLLMDHGLAADNYNVVATADAEVTGSQFFLPTGAQLPADAGAAAEDPLATDFDNVCYRAYLPHATTFTEAVVYEYEVAAAGATDYIGAAIYFDADAGVQITEGASVYAADGAVLVIDIADATVHPGWYRFCACQNDVSAQDWLGIAQTAVVTAVFNETVSELRYGLAANDCTGNGDMPATTGALASSAESMVILNFQSN